MLTNRQLFLQNLAQTSDTPVMLEIEKAEGIYMYGTRGEKYIDLISGISVSNIGHRHPVVVEAVKEQTDKYMHLMVYGEYVQSPQVKLAKLISDLMPEKLNNVYFVNSGSEAVEGALKLAKRFTQRAGIISFRNAYHGSTSGALSVMGDFETSQNFRPLMPGVKQLEFNNIEELKHINEATACVIIEPVQGEAGVILPENDFLQAIRKRCNETGTLLIFDEVQTGFGRTGEMFACRKYGVTPDIMTIAKGMGGGMPIGAFVSSKEIMSILTHNPILGHITTFGGHPVSCAASLAAISFIADTNLVAEVDGKADLFKILLKHDKIKSIRNSGLLMAVELGNFDLVLDFMHKGFTKGIVTDWFLFNNTSFRLAPPLTITMEEIELSCKLILKTLDEI